MNLENYAFIRETHPRASVSYQCERCGMLIRQGEKHCRLVGKPHTIFRQIRFCEACGRESVQEYTQLLFSLNPGVSNIGPARDRPA